MIEDIRKKHEALRETHEWQKQVTPVPYLSKHSSRLTIADVDELFKALDAERGKVKTVVAYAEDVLIGSDHDYAGQRIIEILAGEG